MSTPFERYRSRVRGPVDDDTPRPAADSHITLIEVMEIAHANNAGNVHGGTIMRLADTAAGMSAARHSRHRVVTASMDEMSFLEPVYLGDILHVSASVNEAFRSSMEVGVRVDVEPLQSGEARHVASAYLVFVALDEDGRPTRVAPVLARTPEERRRQEQARIRREQRLVRKQALLAHRQDEVAGSD